MRLHHLVLDQLHCHLRRNQRSLLELTTIGMTTFMCFLIISVYFPGVFTVYHVKQAIYCTSLRISPTDTWQPPNFATKWSECLPFPDPGAPNTKITLLLEAKERTAERERGRVDNLCAAHSMANARILMESGIPHIYDCEQTRNELKRFQFSADRSENSPRFRSSFTENLVLRYSVS